MSLNGETLEGGGTDAGMPVHAVLVVEGWAPLSESSGKRTLTPGVDIRRFGLISRLMQPRELSYDEKKAAEAAFRGLPMDPSWTASARQVYEGIMKAMPQGSASGDPDASGSLEREEPAADQAPLQATSREEAIKAGFLIDVTEQASAMGLKVPVGISRPLWEVGITASEALSEEEQPSRLRDVLLALRLHLVRLPGLPVISQFPALLTFPPEPVPQLYLISALVHPDETHQAAVTLMLPSEISITLESKLN